ncbi:MAG TPA: gamma-glutamyl-gamma-aminobutyrate hydrolase family protein, partial [Alphaproteobacteria bacterium]|nr:gamma-glutamyl-gamma-aminobutyrate hydrolase family protein [Alphaproteobacteria bacterium]
AIGQVFGGKIIRVAPMHGKTSQMHHDGQSVFKGLPTPFEATRYHSLSIEPESFPESLIVTAKTEDGVIMGLQHKDKPIHGVQFHPESIATQHGHAMIQNFLDII